MIHAIRIVALSLPIMLGACAANVADRTAAPEPAIRITGDLAFRDGAKPRPGSIATLTVSDFALRDDGAASVAAESIELDGSQLIVPFELNVPIAGLQPGRRYVVRGSVRSPDGVTAWTTDMAQIIDTDKSETDIGVLMLAPSKGID